MMGCKLEKNRASGVRIRRMRLRLVTTAMSLIVHVRKLPEEGGAKAISVIVTPWKRGALGWYWFRQLLGYRPRLACPSKTRTHHRDWAHAASVLRQLPGPSQGGVRPQRLAWALLRRLARRCCRRSFRTSWSTAACFMSSRTTRAVPVRSR